MIAETWLARKAGRHQGVARFLFVWLKKRNTVNRKIKK